MASNIEKICESLKLGDGPFWDAETQCLYFVDKFGHFIHKYVPSTRKHTKAKIGDAIISVVIPVKGKDDQFVTSIEREIVLISWDGECDQVSIIKKLNKVNDMTDNVFNNGKCDSSGRLWIGTTGGIGDDGIFASEIGCLFSLQNNEITTHLTKVGKMNGLAFDNNLKKMYYIDFFSTISIEQFDFDITMGTISNRKTVYRQSREDGTEEIEILSGMTIDTDGNLWVAVFNHAKIIKIDPRQGDILETIILPTKQVVGLTFGGPNLDVLYVTSAKLSKHGIEPTSPDFDGFTFEITGLNVKGLPDVRIII